MNYKYVITLLTRERLTLKRIKELMKLGCRYIWYKWFSKNEKYPNIFLPIRKRNDCIISFKWNEKTHKIPILFYLPNLNDYIQRYIWLHKSFIECEDLYEFKKYMDESSIIADCGANIGNHTIFFAIVINAKKIYSFEPVPQVFKILKKNIEINNLQSRVVLENTALGQKKTRVSTNFFNISDSSITTVSYCNPNNSDAMPCISLDEYFSNMPTSYLPTHLKIDVEGFELELLKGADKLLTNQHPILFIEIWKRNLEHVVPVLKKYGYVCKQKIGNINYIYVYDS